MQRLDQNCPWAQRQWAPSANVHVRCGEAVQRQVSKGFDCHLLLKTVAFDVQRLNHVFLFFLLLVRCATMCNTMQMQEVQSSIFEHFSYLFSSKFGNLHFWRSAKIAWPNIVRVDCRVWSPFSGDVPCCDTALGAASQ